MRLIADLKYLYTWKNVEDSNGNSLIRRSRVEGPVLPLKCVVFLEYRMYSCNRLRLTKYFFWRWISCMSSRILAKDLFLPPTNALSTHMSVRDHHSIASNLVILFQPGHPEAFCGSSHVLYRDWIPLFHDVHTNRSTNDLLYIPLPNTLTTAQIKMSRWRSTKQSKL